jgi:hypothetical protein
MPVGLRAESGVSAVVFHFPGSESRCGGGGKSAPLQPHGFKFVYSEWQLGQTMGSPPYTDTSLGKSRQAGKFKIWLGAIKKNNGRAGQRRRQRLTIEAYWAFRTQFATQDSGLATHLWFNPYL